MNPIRKNILARRLMFGAALSLLVLFGALLWLVNRRIQDAHLEAITDMLAAREVGELVYVLSKKDCGMYPGMCEQFEKLGPLSTRAELKRVFAPLYVPHVPAASARRIAAAFGGAVGQQANRATREQALKKFDYWKRLSPAQRDAIDALLTSPEGLAYRDARKLVGQQLYDRYNDLLIAQQTQMLSAPVKSIAAYVEQYASYTGETPPPPVVLAPIDNQYYARRAHLMAASASRLSVAYWSFRRAAGPHPDQVRNDDALASADDTARAAAALQQIKPASERYFREREVIYREQFAALTALERKSTGPGGTPDLAEYEQRLASALAQIEADRAWYRLAERVYADALAHPYLMNWGVARPAQVDSALEQRFAQDRQALKDMNSQTRIGIDQRKQLRASLIAGKLGDLIDKDTP